MTGSRGLALGMVILASSSSSLAWAQGPAAAPGTAPEPATDPVAASPALNPVPNPLVVDKELAPGPPQLAWDPHWARASAADYGVTGAAMAVALAGAIMPPLSKHVYGGILFDEHVRNGLRLGSAQARYAARDTSDVLLSLETTYPFFIDGLVVAWGARKSADVAYQMIVIDGEALAIAAAFQGATNTLVSRERPYGRECGVSVPDALNDCTGPGRYRSFFSGHSTLTFTSAGLVCSHHLHLSLQGAAADIGACATAYAVAAATATLRIMGDMHYASDVLTGALVGTAIGLGVPAIHYARRSREGDEHAGLDVRIVPTAGGVAILGELP